MGNLWLLSAGNPPTPPLSSAFLYYPLVKWRKVSTAWLMQVAPPDFYQQPSFRSHQHGGKSYASPITPSLVPRIIFKKKRGGNHYTAVGRERKSRKDHSLSVAGIQQNKNRYKEIACLLLCKHNALLLLC